MVKFNRIPSENKKVLKFLYKRGDLGKFIKNFPKENLKNLEFSGSGYTYLFMSNYSFYWGNSNEGFDYWADVKIAFTTVWEWQ